MVLPSGVALGALSSSLPMRPPNGTCHALEVHKYSAICPAYSYPFLQNEKGSTELGHLPDPIWAYLLTERRNNQPQVIPSVQGTPASSTPTRPSDASSDIPPDSTLSSQPADPTAGGPHQRPDQPASPWSRSPTCRRAGTAEHCAFTHSAFNGRLGISLITTPENILLLGSQPPLNAAPPPGSHCAGDSSFRGAESTPPAPNPYYTSTPIPGKGLGLVAAKPIRAGTRVMNALPAVLVDDGAWKGMRRVDLGVLVWEAVRGLSEAQRGSFMELAGPAEGGAQGGKEFGILATNAFRVTIKIVGEVGEGKGREFHGVFPEVSRLNHDCAPNLGYYFDSATLSQKVYAVRDILPGEELTVSYVDVIQPSSIRQSRLHSGWSFACTCPRCTLEGHLLGESDDRVAHMQQLRRELDDYSTAATPEKAELLVTLYELEGLQVRIYEAYYRAALEWNGVGDAARAAKYARLCLDKGLLLRGGDRPFVESMRELLRDAKRHWSWRFRVKEKGGGESEGHENEVN
ncbi:SET domain-containing protein 5 [Madurella mycetomatis]|uniref:SET domain-containing protein 5 n=1 Tax=Madurella mycetomatis TaxID=100816 RepID=A0A175WC89_9PEZI|nr:SET domain-containing protein 5 [Madurella mycetomatis]